MKSCNALVCINNKVLRVGNGNLFVLMISGLEAGLKLVNVLLSERLFERYEENGNGVNESDEFSPFFFARISILRPASHYMNN